MSEFKDNYWDWVSSQDRVDYTDRDDFATIVKDCLEQLNPYLDRLIWVEANIIYLNRVYDINQTIVGNYLGISQYGVSKRLRKAMERLQVKIKCPEKDYEKAKAGLLPAFGSDFIGVVMSLYIFNNLTMTLALYSNETKESVTDRLHAFIHIDEPNALLKVRGIAHLNPAQLKLSADYTDLLAHEAQIREASAKYRDYFQLILDTTSIGEFVFNKQNRNKTWRD